MTNLLANGRIVAPPGYNRWKVPLASMSILLAIALVSNALMRRVDPRHRMRC